MSKLIISTENTSGKYKKGAIFYGITFCCIGILLIALYFFALEETSEDNVIFFLLGGLFMLGDGIITTAIKLQNAASYMYIYEDRLSGKGVQQLSLVNFDILINQITSITINGIFINLNTTSGTYKITSDKEMAHKVFDYYNAAIRNV